MGKRSASETADLDAALRFVIGRIEEEANRSGKPLSDEERLVLSISEVSRFSCLKFLGVSGVFDYAGLSWGSR